jgi:hypothetical protein
MWARNTPNSVSFSSADSRRKRFSLQDAVDWRYAKPRLMSFVTSCDSDGDSGSITRVRQVDLLVMRGLVPVENCPIMTRRVHVYTINP